MNHSLTAPKPTDNPGLARARTVLAACDLKFAVSNARYGLPALPAAGETSGGNGATVQTVALDIGPAGPVVHLAPNDAWVKGIAAIDAGKSVYVLFPNGGWAAIPEGNDYPRAKKLIRLASGIFNALA